MTITLIESNFDDVELIAESVNGKKFHYIHGIFAQADVVNGNKRVYPEKILDESMNGYIDKFVKTNRAVGELIHPSDLSIGMDRISHLVTEMKKDGKNYVGKARVLNTPTGKIVQALLEGGVRLGVSTRAGGKVITNSRGLNEVAPGLDMKAIDIVYNPSAPNALVDSIMESVDGVIDALSDDMQLVESIKADILKASSRELQSAKLKAFKQIMESLRA
jgi:Prohead core protein serine protease